MNAAARQTETNAIQHPPSEVMQLGRAAVAALYDEVALYPKPGLVSFVDAGSHRDMDAQTFMRSLFALRRYFGRVACLGWQGADFSELERCGIDAEADMLRATGGVNTHRGAIFTLGLLCAAAGSVLRSGERPDPQRLRAALRNRWGSTLAARARRAPVLPGGLAARQHGLRGASEEAALAFPVLFETAWPALQSGLAAGLADRPARLNALMHAMAVLDDSNLAHRGGLAGLRYAQQAAGAFLCKGGVAHPEGMVRMLALHRAFVARRLSPGGAADMLAAACWLQRIGALR